ncbi:beta-N-acetylhexosaminidase [Halomonas sp. TD01]|uniref:beta-N-acetylhexosaminidase n=1 Tax=Halomonas sp. TD01 TaxID=999141 RepID=UPI000214DEDD|nr:beta-N-acetylhexosaminidase [Halomonas sp. TD01]EGP20517.1 chitobiase precursor [Halomonas sp. TD01]CAH1041595.1 beta-N-acetylglucosaminidase (EC [Halomonas sp. TD01]
MTKLTMKALTALAVGIAINSVAAQASEATQLGVSSAHDLAQRLDVQYTITANQPQAHNIDCQKLGADYAACFTATILLTNTSDEAIEASDWGLYFSSIRRLLKMDHPELTLTRITGDLHRIEPNDAFTGLGAGESLEIPIVGEYWQLFMTDVMPNWYLAVDDETAVIDNTRDELLTDFVGVPEGELLMRTPEDRNVVMTAETRFERNAAATAIPAEALRGAIVPTPQSSRLGKATLDLSEGVSLVMPMLSEASIAALGERFERLDIPVNEGENGLVIRARLVSESDALDDALARKGGYRLQLDESGADILAFDAAGAFYAVQSLIAATDEAGLVPAMDVDDAPRYDYRGVMLDVARNFKDKASVLRLLDQMAAYKLNRFHFHLTDDEGWRLEIPGLAELTEVGSKRCHDLDETNCLLPQLGSGPAADTSGSGFYTREDYIDIVRYAEARHIRVIPEIDMPAHARAAVVAMEARHHRLLEEGDSVAANEYRLIDPEDMSNTLSVQLYDRRSYLNPCLESTHRFVDKVMGEVVSMHQEAGQTLENWHFGGDEAKNILLGHGFQDIDAKEAVDWRGTIDQRDQHHPWEASPICQQRIASGEVASVEELPSRFALQVNRIANAYGIPRMSAWQDGLKHVESAAEFATPQVAVNFWDPLFWGGSQSVAEWQSRGYEVILSSPDYLYFDMPYEVNPYERGYYWATRFTDTRKVFSFAPDNLAQNAETSVDRDGNTFRAESVEGWQGARGISGQAWGETVRSEAQMEYMIFPRLLALAERAWHRAEWELGYRPGQVFVGGETSFVDHETLTEDWQRFANLLGQRILPRLEQDGIAYRLPLPGARIEAGRLEANVALPGVAIEYSLDDGVSWQSYQDSAPPQVENTTVLLRSIGANGQQHSRVVTLN